MVSRGPAGTGPQRRVLYIQPAVAIGGAERQASVVLPLLERFGLHVTAVAGPGAEILAWFRQRNLPDFVGSPNFPDGEKFALTRVPRYARLALDLFRELDVLHRAHPFDAIIGSLGYGWAVAGLCGQRWGVPVIWRAGGLSLGSTSDPDSAEARGLRLMTRLLSPAVLLCNADAVASYFAQFVKTPVRVVHNGVPLPADTLRAANEDGPLHVGFGGRLAPEKNLPSLLEAISIARTRGTELRATIAGPGDTAALQQRAQALGVSELVKIVGRVDDMAAFYRSIDAFVLPSESEGCANVVLEAMSHGLPVIATEVGGTPELLRDGVEGLLVPRRNPWALAIALEKMARSPQLRVELGRRARERAAWFSPERAAQALAAVLHEVIATRASARRSTG